jgi:RimJ/RimL family protein N-acetyltransferase
MITFRPLSKDDVPFLTDVRNECADRYLHTSSKFSVDETINWFDNTKPTFYVILYNGVKIGYFRITNYSHVNKNLYIGADLHQDFRGKGLAYESYRKFIPTIIKQYGLHKVSLEVLATNTRAHNLYIKLGFVNEGAKRQEVYKNGQYVDSIIMSILKSEVESNNIYCTKNL